MGVSISPQGAGLTAGQQITLTATSSDSTNVMWSISPSGGSFSASTSSSGAGITFTAPASAGSYTITATSVSSSSETGSISIGVTQLAGIYTYHDDPARDGANTQEYALTTANVNTTNFGKLFSCPVDGAIFAQPLWVANLSVNGTTRNVVLVATQHDSLFAFDADANPCVQLWQASLIDTNHGGTGAETTVSTVSGPIEGDPPEIGVTGTPVIDPTTNILYVVSQSVSTSGSPYYHRLHAIDITTGNEMPGAPVTVAATYPGSGDGGMITTFNPGDEFQRSGLALLNGTVYIAWASHGDNPPYYGWLIGYTYNGSTLSQAYVLNVTPNAGYGGIWMGGGAPAIDSEGNLYVITGNGTFDATSAATPNNDYGDSLLKLTASLTVSQYFTPSDQASDALNDNDFGSGGTSVLADLPAGSPVTHLLVGGGKDGNLYVLNRDSLGGSGDSNAWQEMNVGPENLMSPNAGVMYATPAFWNNTLYLGPAGQPLATYALDTTTALLSMTGTAAAPSGGIAFPGSTPSVSASGTTNGIVWAIDASQYCLQNSPGCGPAVLHAYDATNLANELWNSTMVSADSAGNAVKFTVPTVANGKVYVGTRGDNQGGLDDSTSTPGELDVYGLKPN